MHPPMFARTVAPTSLSHQPPDILENDLSSQNAVSNMSLQMHYDGSQRSFCHYPAEVLDVDFQEVDPSSAADLSQSVPLPIHSNVHSMREPATQIVSQAYHNGMNKSPTCDLEEHQQGYQGDDHSKGDASMLWPSQL